MNGATHTTSGDQANRLASEDEEKRAKIEEIIDHQFDLEIFLKYREISAIREEIGKAEEILIDIRQAVHNDVAALSAPEAQHNTRRSALQAIASNKSFPLPSISSSLQFDTAQRQARPNFKFSSDNSTKTLFGRRADGVYVSLACPRCHRDDFANQQGFLNHCRIAHGLEFGPYEEMIKQCGTPIDESEVPFDHPIRLRPLTKPLTSNRTKKADVKRPTIKVFDEDVVLDSDDEDNALVLPARDKVPIQDANLQESSDNCADIPSKLESSIKREEGDLERVAPVKEGIHAKVDVPCQQQNVISQEMQPKKESGAEETKPVESISVVVNPHTNEHGSRFYIKKRVILGNVSKFIPIDKREPGLRQYTHKWMIYVTTPPGDENIASFISCVRYHLHPSYKPSDVIDVNVPPFHLSRLGWGEFPIRVQLHFADSRRNKLVDVFHQLKLDDSHSGQQTLGSERYIALELDRNTEFIDPKAAVSRQTLPDNRNEVTGQVVQRRDPLDELMRSTISSFPIIRAHAPPSTQTTTYCCAPTTNMYFDYHVGHRKALEWQRSRAFRLAVQQQAIASGDPVLKQAAETLTTKKCVLWCRENEFTPIKMHDTSIGKPVVHNVQEEIALGYCKFCGTLRALHTYDSHVSDEACQYRPKGWSYRKRTGGMNSVTNILPLLQKLGKGWDQVKEQDDMELDIDQSTLPIGDKLQTNATEPKTLQLVEEVRTVETERIAEMPDPARERGLDWIWASVDQLRLPSVIANDIVQTRDGDIQTKDDRCTLEEAIDQRLVAGSLLYEATKVLLRRILKGSANIYRNESSSDNTTSPSNHDQIEPYERKLLVPNHVYQCLQKEDQFDFLTNKHLNLEEATDNETET
ncbi:hypothetical protein K450DRAFT_245038 [Umbelopsis ramanniana AG]|uniref:YEATS domain-containing protein n=1 Tax=Umbelopsis ramanniana AG TaxID=1314678 RepID=A0AAD5E7P2_UMBRA|nr:uncharacterized protein K450DRAFT_245038 [Umbelopsis ramanniana AG]KAI8578901.1 hypothetical protein K450DRAFT_245038 [Umbelopsis ramanniana AG]